MCDCMWTQLFLECDHRKHTLWWNWGFITTKAHRRSCSRKTIPQTPNLICTWSGGDIGFPHCERMVQFVRFRWNYHRYMGDQLHLKFGVSLFAVCQKVLLLSGRWCLLGLIVSPLTDDIILKLNQLDPLRSWF